MYHRAAIFICCAGLLMDAIIAPNYTHAQSTSVIIHTLQTSGKTANDELIQLYNTSEQPVNISSWSLQYKSATGDRFYKKNFEPESILAPQGYFTIASKDYTGQEIVHLQHASFNMASSGGHIYLVNSQKTLSREYDEAVIIDKVGWGDADDAETASAVPPEPFEQLRRFSNLDTNNNAHDFSVKKEGVSEEPEERPENIPLTDKEQNSNTQTEHESARSKTDHSGQAEDQAVSIIINELFPNPYGIDTENEWVELKNSGFKTIDILGWTLSDNKTTHTINTLSVNNTIIQPGSFVLLLRSVSNIALNNTGGDTVTLKNTQGNTIDSVSYSVSTPEGESFARTNTGDWEWTIANTPGSENVIVKNINKASKEYQQTPQEPAHRTAQDSLVTNVSNNKTIQEQSINYDHSKLIINELLPNPVGSDEEGEWIELYNSSTSTLPLARITLEDASRKTLIFDNETNIEPHDFLLILKQHSRISLNNSGDTITLLDHGGQLIDTVSYNGPSREGVSYARTINGSWEWTVEPTPESENAFPVTIDENNAINHDDAINDTGTYITVPLSKIRTIDTGTAITVRGVVVVEPGVFGTTYFYIVEEKSGIKIYDAKKNFPPLVRGDYIEISGTLSQNNDELRVKTSTITLIEQQPLPEPILLALSNIDELNEGSLIRVEGEVKEVKGSNIYLTDNDSIVRIYIVPNTGISSKGFKAGDVIAVTGLLSQTKTGYRILPRDNNDIVKNKPQEIAGVNTQNILVKSRTRPHNKLIYALLVLLVGGAAGMVWYIKHKKTKTPTP